MFKRKKKKTGCEMPEYRRPTLPPNPNLGWQPAKSSGTKPPKTPTSGSNAFKPGQVAVLPNDISTVTIMCQYETPCGWCAKWDKKCDKKIGCEPPILNMSHSISNEVLATIQDGVYKTTMISEEQLERKLK